MKLVRVFSLSATESRKIRCRQKHGTMKEYFENGYLCFDEDELATYKPRKSGRRVKTYVDGK